MKLEGTILGEHGNALRDFLQNVTYFPGNRWTLQLEDLDAISLRGLRVLLKFAKVIRQRGYEVEIKSIPPSVLATMQELNMCEYFAWKNKENKDRVNSLSKTPNQEGWRHHEIRMLQF